MSKIVDETFSKYQCGFRRGHGAQHCLIALLEEWCISVNKGLEFGALITDLSMAFDCLPHSLLLAKISAYGFHMKALCFINDYLRDRKQRTKISNTYSSWEKILHGVSQGSILGPLLFSIDLCDLFVIMDQHGVANYADYSTPYISRKNIMRLLNR